MAVAKKKAEFKIPKTLAACADGLFETREKRLELQRQAKELREQKSKLKQHLIETLLAKTASGVAGRIVPHLTLVNKVPYR